MANHSHAERLELTLQEMDKLRGENTELRTGSGLVVHALDRAIALTEQLFVFLPAGTVLPEAVSGCKHQLDEAMRAIGHTPSASEPTVLVAEHSYKHALDIAGQNIVTLTEQRSKLTSALSQAILLIEELLTVMRQRGVTPSGPVVVTKAALDRQMRELSALARKDNADN